MKELVFRYAPVWFQNLAISVYNWNQWRMRHRGVYSERVQFFRESSRWTEDQWRAHQASMLKEFLAHSASNSSWYRGYINTTRLEEFPVLSKEDLINNLARIATITEQSGVTSFTGGTTGASMKVLYTIEDTQTRFAMVDWFRAQHGWELGKRTAWFSGKAFAQEDDVRRGSFWRDDWITKTRFFSTFHINAANFERYWQGLIDFDPEFIVGFPSSLSNILEIAKSRGFKYPSKVKAFFPTAETVLPFHRDIALEVLGCTTHDQYASSEGAPFILECSAGRLHIMPLSGVFEVVDDHLAPTRSGELLVTSFTTHGTPLIRYRVGDRVTLADSSKGCNCGWSFPIVESIEGRNTDFLWSPQMGRINLGNLSNSTKGVSGIIAFQVIQNDPNSIRILVQASSSFDQTNQSKFLNEIRQRTGPQMQIELTLVENIEREKSGKFRIVKNYLNSQQMKLL